MNLWCIVFEFCCLFLGLFGKNTNLIVIKCFLIFLQAIFIMNNFLKVIFLMTFSYPKINHMICIK